MKPKILPTLFFVFTIFTNQYLPAQSNLYGDCAEARAQAELNINNVRATLLNAGDMWWDLEEAGYIVPNVEGNKASSIFSGGIWIGGLDEGNNLKIAAQTYRQSGNDFWPGPINEQHTTDSLTCLLWDRFFEVKGDNIRKHLMDYGEFCSYNNDCEYDCDQIPEDVKKWPGRGNPYFQEYYGFELPNTMQGMAPFYDQDGDGLYNPCKGDFPKTNRMSCDKFDIPDQMIYWVFNDAGNIHGNSGGDIIRMEVHNWAYAYNTLDVLNDATFYHYRLVNRSIEPIDSTYFGIFIHPKIGGLGDDYIGSVPENNFAYFYNADDFDEDSFSPGYGDKIPALGVDLLRGPLDEYGYEVEMSSFTYFYNNTPAYPPAMTLPEKAIEYYRYLSGSWKDGTPFSYGGNGYNPGAEPFSYAFPGLPNEPDQWSMCSEDLPPGDRRTLMSFRPFRLDPGAVNELLMGVIWVPELEYPCPDISRLIVADEYLKCIFDDCILFEHPPHPPAIDILELDQKIELVLSNLPSSNNYMEGFKSGIPCNPQTLENSYHKFEGYKIFQLENSEVKRGNLDDPDKARLVAQVDIINGISEIINWEPHDIVNPTNNERVYIPRVMVEGADEGIRHTFTVTNDLFASSNSQKLVNHKKYYFTAIAYAYNNYQPFDPETELGQNQPYYESNVFTIKSAIPRPLLYDEIEVPNGYQPPIIRLDGKGNMNGFLDPPINFHEIVLNNTFNGSIKYQPGEGPFEIKVIDPFSVKEGTYQLKMTDSIPNDLLLADQSWWELTYLKNDTTIRSSRPLNFDNEQYLAPFGLSIRAAFVPEPGDLPATNGAIGASITYENPLENNWLSWIHDTLPIGPFNFLQTDQFEVDFDQDPQQIFTDFNDGFFFPYRLANWRRNSLLKYDYISPAWKQKFNSSVLDDNPMSNLNNVNIVLTAEKSKWSRCVIIEAADSSYTNAVKGLGLKTQFDDVQGCYPEQFELRGLPSVSKDDLNDDGLPDPDNAIDENGNPVIGKGWFPGYAIDAETGERLNIFFGENSTYTCEEAQKLGLNCNEIPSNGADMMWNPSSKVFIEGAPFPYSHFSGGQHFIYVTNEPYDSCNYIYSRLRCSDGSLKKLSALKSIQWTSVPILHPEYQLLNYQEGLIPNVVTVKLRVTNRFQTTDSNGKNGGLPMYEFKIDGQAATPITQTTAIENAMDNIRLVPNPFYLYSEYDQDEGVMAKITNLPPKCTVTIYTLNGKVVEQYKRDEAPLLPGASGNSGLTQQQFFPDLEINFLSRKGRYLASGMYLVHVDAGEWGERVLKWLVVLK